MTEPNHRILVVDDDRALAELLRRILTKEGFDVTVSHNGEDAIQRTMQTNYALALLDVMLPGMDGYTVCRRLRQNPTTQYLPILMLTAKGDIADKIAGFEVGADDYLTKPFQPKDLVYRVRSLIARSQNVIPGDSVETEQGRVIAVFGSKGGVGKTTIATNLAVALRQRSEKRVALLDADFFFGDVGVHLNLPAVRTVYDLIKHPGDWDTEIAEQTLIPHPSGIRVLLSPFRPEDGEQVTVGHIEKIVKFLARHYDFVVIDCQPSYGNRMLKVMELSTDVLMVVTPEVGPLKNTSLFLDWVAELGYSVEKVNIVLNRYNSNVGIGAEEIERTLEHQVTFRVMSGGRPVVMSVNRGVPLVIEEPEHPFSTQILQIADFYIDRATSSLPSTMLRSTRNRRTPPGA
ncbi:MAG: response regulator [Ardenticatenales bacterium]|nr:response regulator [Ardenticatenales bacterium]